MGIQGVVVFLLIYVLSFYLIQSMFLNCFYLDMLFLMMQIVFLKCECQEKDTTNIFYKVIVFMTK